MIISCIGQKGGGAKSTIARTLAVGFTEAGWKTHLADIDEKQQTSLKWCKRRSLNNETPSFSASIVSSVYLTISDNSQIS